MSFDAEAYAREVLEPARLAGNQPPSDLVLRYGLALPLDPAQIAATLPALLGCWRRVRRELKYRKLVTRLEADHARLAQAFEKAKAGDLRALRAAIDAASSADNSRRRSLGREVEDIAGPVRRITTELARDLAARHGLDPGEVAAHLLRAGIEQSTPDPLPNVPPVGGYQRYREALRTLGCRHTIDFVADGGEISVWDVVSVPGQPVLGTEAVHAADRTWAARPHDGSRTLASAVLVALKALVAERGSTGLTELVRYEVAEELRVRHRQGASAAALVEYAEVSLGLTADDARRLAFAVRAELPQSAAPQAPTAPVPETGPSRSAAPLSATPSSATPLSATPSSATPSSVTPLSAAPSSATPSSATPSSVTPLSAALSPTSAPSTVTAAPLGAAAPPQETREGNGEQAGPANEPISATPPGSAATAPDLTRQLVTPGALDPGGAVAPVTAPRPAPLGAYAPLPSLSHISAERAGDEVVVRWQWPTELTEVSVRWRPRIPEQHDWREKAISRGAYRSQGGAWLPVGDGLGTDHHQNMPLEIELVPLAPRHGRRVTGAPVTVRVPGRVEARYEVTRTGPPWRRELMIAVRTGQHVRLRRLTVVLRQGTVMPLHALDGEILRQLDDILLGPGEPLRLRIPAPQGPYWLRCFAADDEIDLRDPPVAQLRGR